jgi:hypothetical protein
MRTPLDAVFFVLGMIAFAQGVRNADGLALWAGATCILAGLLPHPKRRPS